MFAWREPEFKELGRLGVVVGFTLADVCPPHTMAACFHRLATVERKSSRCSSRWASYSHSESSYSSPSSKISPSMPSSDRVAEDHFVVRGVEEFVLFVVFLFTGEFSSSSSSSSSKYSTSSRSSNNSPIAPSSISDGACQYSSALASRIVEEPAPPRASDSRPILPAVLRPWRASGTTSGGTSFRRLQAACDRSG